MEDEMRLQPILGGAVAGLALAIAGTYLWMCFGWTDSMYPF